MNQIAATATEPESPHTAAPADRVYFPELDGLRFIAFGMVFLFHQGLPWPLLSRLIGRTATRCFSENGWVGVQLFFILSGYLITTLLLREESAFGRVDLKAFWVRRILRIWPLYYLTVTLTFLLIPWLSGDYATAAGREVLGRHLPAFLGFLGNWSMIARGPVPRDDQSILWSVCVEEQFYLIVPLIIAVVASRFRVALVTVLMASAVLIRAILARAGANQLGIQYNTFAQFDTLLSGVLLALFLGPNPREGQVGRWLKWLQWPLYVAALWLLTQSHLGHGEPWRRTWDFVAIWATMAGIVAVAVTVPGRLRVGKVGQWLKWLQWPFYAAVLWLLTQSHPGHGEPWRRTWDFVAIWATMAGIVAVAVTVPGWLRAGLAYSRMVWLGKISYGLYMYHEIAFWLRDRLGYQLGWFPNNEVLLPIAGFAITVGLAAASYYGFESKFLRLKRGWTRVPSRPV